MAKPDIAEVRIIVERGVEPAHEIIVNGDRFLIHDTEGVEDYVHAFYVSASEPRQVKRGVAH